MISFYSWGCQGLLKLSILCGYLKLTIIVGFIVDSDSGVYS